MTPRSGSRNRLDEMREAALELADLAARHLEAYRRPLPGADADDPASHARLHGRLIEACGICRDL